MDFIHADADNKTNNNNNRTTMEEELRCFACKQLYNNPVLLPCYHALCLNCAVHIQQPVVHNGTAANGAGENAESVASGSSTSDYQESDKLSILSETDSGVVCTSRPSSYVGTPNGGVYASALNLACPACHKVVYFDENGAHNLPKFRVMQHIVDRYGAQRNLQHKCQMCAGEPANDAVVVCEQCEIFYCEDCRDTCHPMRGPLAKHTIVEAKRGSSCPVKLRDGKCAEHAEENLTMYCIVCKSGACALCLMDGRHNSHDVQAITTMCKAQKVRRLF